ncbi:sensor histidine kinase [Xanthobacter autotrophicus]|uniref:sensor histidine kinase n=1 Tax=Xanthobacter autotrophicus TaxID=280 RepID=UPI0024A7746A|nr:sensor histidine kinase [Xanthobacter autotrophicus]MDI4658405.1 sensor histidine kinase [Xanthobacter autotrophicus]
MAICLLLLGTVHPGCAEPARRHVLVLFENNRLLPGNVLGDRGITSALAEVDRSTEISTEFLDYPRFSGAAYVATVTRFLKEKYAARPPGVIIVAGDKALDFALNTRAGLFPHVPVVHVGVARSFLASRPPLPDDVVGVPFDRDFAATIGQALDWHPQARHLVLVTGASEQDRNWEEDLRRAAGRFEGRVGVEMLAGRTTAQVLKRVGELGTDAVVVTPGFFRDGAGSIFTPAEAVRLIAQASRAPVYGPFVTFIGTGAVGGWMTSFEAMGREGGSIANRLLAGQAPSALRLPQVMPVALHVDWRQIERWGIDPAAVPADAIIQFRSPGFWQTYSRETMAVALAFLLQSLLLTALLLERNRRRSAQSSVDRYRFELAHASRLAVAGELTGSIAHEINQPLAAILSNAAAAEMMLESGAARPGDLKDILADIRRDDLRASEVIRRLRALLAKHEVERQPFDLNEILSDVIALLGAEARRRRIALSARAAAETITVVGDRIQLQQVLINLIMNAMDALADTPEEQRNVALSLEGSATGATIRVRDRGHGITAEHLAKLFESFFTTKRKGIGLGLSIARTLVEAHGGTIAAESVPGEGAVFTIWLPRVAPGGSVWVGAT